jgi:hypothetical protein
MFKSPRRWSEPSTLTCSLVAALGIACSEDAGVRQPMNGGSGGSAPVNPIPTGGGNGPIGLPKGMPGGIPGQAPQRTCEVCEDFPATPIVVE